MSRFISVKRVKKAARKALSVTLSITTVVWLSGVGLLAPVAVAQTAIVDGDLIQATGDFDVYIVKLVNGKKFKRLILNPDIFNQYGHLKWENIKQVSQATLDEYTTSTLVRALDPANGVDDPKVYKLFPAGDVGVKRWMNMSAEEFVAQGNDWDAVYTINAFERDSYTTGDPITGGTGVTGQGFTFTQIDQGFATAAVPLGATNVEYLKFKITASEDGTVNTMTFTRTNVGSANDINNVYLYEGDKRLTSGKSVSSDTNQVVLTNLNIALASGESKTYSLIIDQSTTLTAGDINSFELTSVDATVDVSGFPFTGPAYSISASSAGSVTIATGGTPTNPTLGQKQATVAKFKLTAGSGEDIKVKRVALSNSGSANLDNFSNWGLWRGAEELASATVKGDVVTFVFDTPFLIKKGEARSFEVKTDLESGLKANETIRLYLDETADLFAEGQSFGYGASVTNSFTSSSGSTSLTIQGGDVTIAFNGPIAQNVQRGGTDVEVFNFSMTSEENVEVRQIQIKVTAVNHGGFDGGNDADDTFDQNLITDIKVVDVDTDTVVAGPKDINAGTESAASTNGTVTMAYTDRWNINAGQTRNLKVTVDFANDTDLNNDVYRFDLVAFGASDVKSLDTGNFLATTQFVPNTNVQGNNQTVTAASLALSLASTPVSTTYVKGTTGVDMLGILLTAGDASKIVITALKTSAYVDDTTSGTFTKDTDGTVTALNLVSSLSLYDGSTLVAGPKTIDSSGETQFDSFSFTVPAGETKKLVLKGNVSTTAPENGSSDRIKFDVAAAADVTAEDQDGNTVTATGNAFNSTTSDAGVRITVANAGSLAAALDSASPKTDIILSGDTGVVMSKFRFSATNEAFTVTKLQIKNQSSAYDDNVAAVKLEYPKQDGSTGTATGFLSGGTVNFTGLSFWVPKDSFATLTVKADLDTIGGSGGADSGDQPRLDFDYNTSFEAVGSGSGSSVTSVGSADVTANAMIVRKSKPTFELATSGMSTTLNNGTVDLIKFKVTSASKESADVAVKKVKLDVQLFDAATSTALTVGGSAGWTIYDVNDLSTDLGANASAFGDGSGSADPSFTASSGSSSNTLYIEFDSEERIAAGSSKTYLVRASVSNAAESSAGKDTISTRLATEEDANVRTGAITDNVNNLVQVASTSTSYAWSDISAGEASHSATLGSSSSDWTNAYKVKTLPSTYFTLSK